MKPARHDQTDLMLSKRLGEDGGIVGVTVRMIARIEMDRFECRRDAPARGPPRSARLETTTAIVASRRRSGRRR